MGAPEGRHIGEWLKRRFGRSVAYRPEASVSTDVLIDDPTRGYTVTEELVRLFAREGHPRFRDLPRHPVYAVLMQTQSVAGAFKLASAFAQTRGIDLQTRDELRNLIFRHVEVIARMMADDPELTVDSEPVRRQFAALDANVEFLLESAAGDNRRIARIFRTAQELTREMIKTMTADELREVWRELNRRFKEILDASGGQGGPQ